jgi:hypothetical protein
MVDCDENSGIDCLIRDIEARNADGCRDADLSTLRDYRDELRSGVASRSCPGNVAAALDAVVTLVDAGKFPAEHRPALVAEIALLRGQS